MPFATVNKIKFYYETAGRGTPVIFLHGFTLDLRMWARQVEHFSKNYKTFAYDSRGHGQSDCPASGYSRDDRVSDLYRLARYLKLGKFHLVGLSMGGATALGYALDHPDDLLSLTLVDSAAGGYKPPSKYQDLRQVAVEQGVEEAKRRWMKSTLFYFLNRNESLKEELREMMKGHCGQLWLDHKRGKYKDRDDVSLSAHLKIPTMIFVGEKDRFFLPLAKTLHENIENSELDIVAGVGHMLNMEAPQRFNMRLEQFLNRVEGM